MQNMSVLDRFFYQVKGQPDGREWVFLHGLMGFSANWMKIVSELQGSESCLVFDQRGHGRSFHPDSGYAAKDYAMDLHEITEALSWKYFVLVGHSLGARNALAFSELFPEKVEKLILEDPAVDFSAKSSDYYENLLAAIPSPFSNRDQARAFFQVDFAQKVKTREGGQMMAQFFYANMKEQPDGTVDWRFSKKGIIESVRNGANQDSWTQIQNLTRPTLVVRGERSQELSRESLQRILSLNPMIQGIEVRDAGHWVHADQPQVFTDVLKDFVGVGKRP
jgi:esterase